MTYKVLRRHPEIQRVREEKKARTHAIRLARRVDGMIADKPVSEWSGRDEEKIIELTDTIKVLFGTRKEKRQARSEMSVWEKKR